MNTNKNTNTIGVFLGSFNPSHIGHEHIITSAWNSNVFDKIYIIPAYQNPWKCSQTNYPTYDERLHMCHMMFDNLNSNIIVSDFENTHHNNILNNTDSTSYTYEMLHDFEKTLNCHVNIITTCETFMDIINWHCGVEMLNEFNYYIINDMSDNWNAFIKYIQHHKDVNYKLINSDGIPDGNITTNISSTKIRTLFEDYYMLKNSFIIPHYTSDEIIKYIKEKHFYENM